MGNKKRGPLARLWYRVRLAIWCRRIDRQVEKAFDTPEKRNAVQYLTEQLAAVFQVPVEVLTGNKQGSDTH